MGLLQHKAIYSTKYLNAEITDSGSNFHVVHIKYIIGDFFITKIDNQTYAFRIDGSKIKTFHTFGMWSVRKLYYDISHYNPIDGNDNTEIQKFLEVNELPRMDKKLFDVLKFLGKRETAATEEHDFATVFEEVAAMKNNKEYKSLAQNMENYLKQLGRDKIVAPVKKITELIQDDLLATDAKFLGDTLSIYQQMDNEDKIMTNVPVRAKKEWFKFLAVMLGVVLIATIIYMGITMHWFDHLGPSLNFGPTKASPDIMSRYSSPEAAKAAIDRGEIAKSAFPPQFQTLIDKVQLPTVTPQAKSVEIGATP